jgi:hypothetical protein
MPRSQPKSKRSYHKRRGPENLVTTTVGFIRVRKRKLKPKFRWSKGTDKGGCRYKIWDKTAPTSLSYDLVRAVRINGQPRHKFVLGFGSPASASKGMGERRGITFFWMHSFDRMEEQGFPREQRFHIAEMLACKGIALPAVKECRVEKAKNIKWRAANPEWGTDHEAHYDAVIAFVKRKGAR